MPSVQLKDRIRELCAKAISATGAELDATLAELQKALHQHTEELRKQIADKLRRANEETSGLAFEAFQLPP